MENVNGYINELKNICQFGNNFTVPNKYIELLCKEFETEGYTLEDVIDNVAHTYATTRKIENPYSNINNYEIYKLIENSVSFVLYYKFRLNYLDIFDKFNYTMVLSDKIIEEIRLCTEKGYKRIFSKIEEVIISEEKKIKENMEVKKNSKIKRNFTKTEIEEARSINLVDYLLSRGENIKRVGSKGEYTLQEHDSMRINENKFVWNSQGINGNAIDFCMKYYNMSFKEAVSDLLSFNGHIRIDEYVTTNAKKTVEKKQSTKLLESEPIIKPIPYDLDSKTNRVYAYLTKTRQLDVEIVKKLIEDGSIAQDIKGNVVFKIFDKYGNLTGAEITGTLTDNRYKQITERNNNGFILNPVDGQPQGAVFFESAIDLLSYYSLHPNAKALLVSMAGLKGKVILKTMQDYNIKPDLCYVSSDADEAGSKFAAKVVNEYGVSVYRVIDDKQFDKHKNIKDWNDLLRAEKSFVQAEQNKKIDKIIQDEKADFSVGDIIKYDNDIWEIIKIDGEASIEIKNINNPEWVLPIISSSIGGSWKDIFAQEKIEVIDNVKEEKLPLGKTESNEQIDLFSDNFRNNVNNDIDNEDLQDILSKAFATLKNNNNFTIETEKLIDRIEKQMRFENLQIFNFDVLQLPIFQDNYGPIQRIDKKYFDGHLEDIAIELNQYLSESVNNSKAVQNLTDSIKFSIDFTENSILQKFINENEISFALGNAILKYLDTKAEAEYNGGYDKTDFVINAVIDGETLDYEGRFDIGSEHRNGCDGLTGHIEEYYKYQLDKNSNNLSIEELNSCRDIINTLVPFLKNYEQMTISEQEIFKNFCAENPIKENHPLSDYILENEVQNINSEAIKSIEVGDEITLDNKVYVVNYIDDDFMMSMDNKAVLNGDNLGEGGRQFIGNWRKQLLEEAGINPILVIKPSAQKDLVQEVFVQNEPNDFEQNSNITDNNNSYNEFVTKLYAIQNDFNSVDKTKPIIIGKTPNVLTLAGADKNLDLIINIRTIQKCMSEPTERYHGHSLDVETMSKILSELENPVMILKGSHENSIVAVTSLRDNNNTEILVSIDVNTSSVHHEVNRITSAYGKEHISNYLKNQLIKGNIVAINKEKAEKLFQSLGLQLPQEEKLISYNSSVAYTLKNVKHSDKNLINDKKNFAISNNNFAGGTAKEKYKNNISAIKTLLIIENENRTATSEEQDILAKYVGWGGLSDAFDERKTAWASEYAELKNLLTPDEYSDARSSTLNAHYTSPIIINAMYKGLKNLGFVAGKILEPAMGIGNFFGMLPVDMRKSKLYGVELDNISGRIAKQLYPDANIQIKGFEKTAFKSNFFDVAIGNVPFGNYRLNDNDFKDNDLIHDFFFKKSLDKVRPGGIVAFITSKGTLDKQDNAVRKYLAERADLLGAIRLPNNAFKANAGTEVTSDIIFLQKRDRVLSFTDNMPDWVNLAENDKGILLNKYFINHNEMILGNMAEVSGRFGIETACLPIEGANLAEQLHSAISNIKGTITQDYVKEIEEDNNISTSINVEKFRNYCYAVVNDELYYRENDNMIKQDLITKKSDRIKGMVKISKIVQDLISAQKNDLSDNVIKDLQTKLNTAYDNFVAAFGILSEKNNKSAFADDDTAALLLSLENLDKDGKLESKADIFTKRTIRPYKPIEYTETASEALAISISEKGRVDLEYMSSLCNKEETEIIKDLQGIIFENPVTKGFENADEYLSGNVREKLKIAKEYAQMDNKYLPNVKALENVQPEDLKPEDITVQLGSTWIPNKYYDQFIYYLLDTPMRCRSSNLTKYSGNPFNIGRTGNSEIIMTDYDEYTAKYAVSNKLNWDADRNNIKAITTYGTERMNAYKIIEETLNMKNVCIYDYVENEKGNKKAVLNNKETLLAQEKQDLIKRKFKEWIFDDYDRTKDLCKIYNEKFNSIRLREYDGSHIIFPGMNPEIKLRKHQVDAIAHTLYGGNTLLAHAVGAGKSYEMIASAMESKRLGLCNKSMIVVPKPIVKQMAKEFLQLYPAANILVPSENDFTAANRQRFCSRIATGNYDAIIISHNQLESIPLSEERQRNFIESEIKEITDFLTTSKLSNDNRKGFTVKQLEATKKGLETKLAKLSSSKHDRTITFEELGVDKIYVDEAHNFKNKFFATKMSNVAGISTSTAQKSEDLYMKCRYLDEKTKNKGVVFATGTPISNSMVELYTMQTYLQYDTLKNMGLHNFDAWASTFGETQIGLELSPEGKGYRLKTRFNKFNNIPELMNMFKTVADIKTADMLNLPVPTANYHTIATEASEYQKDMIDKLAERAEAIRNGSVDRHIDNMPMITNDGKKIALDQRLVNPLLPDDPNSKVNVCVENIFKIWQDTIDSRSTQLLFCDFSTPNRNKFNVYDDVKEKLIKKGIPEKEIAFIHDYNSTAKKIELFNKMKVGDIRVLLGSTSKLGTGTNCQNKLKAVHHLDCPYKPSDLEQRNGRIIRQGNENKEVDIYTYVTKNTFDAYLYQLVENKQKFISQIMTSKSFARVSDDVDECVLNYAEVKAIASGDPRIKEKIDLEIEVNKLRTSFAAYQENKRKLQKAITEGFPNKIQSLKQSIEMMEVDSDTATKTKTEDFSLMEINGVKFTDKKEAGTAFLNCCKNVTPQKGCNIGNYRGFEMLLNFDASRATFQLTLKGAKEYYTDIGNDVFGNITRIDNTINGITKNLINAKKTLENTEEQFVAARIEVNNTFLKLPELREKESRLNKLNNELSIDGNTGINKDIERKEQIVEKSHRGIHH